MNTIKSKTPNIYHSTKECIDDHQYVKFWNDNPNSVDYKIKSYIVRDFCFNPERNVKELFQQHCKKVGMIYDKETRLKLHKRDFIEFISNKVMDVKFPDDIDLENEDDVHTLSMIHIFHQFLTNNKDKYMGDNERYDRIMELIDSNASLYQIYNQFTSQELDWIGW